MTEKQWIITPTEFSEHSIVDLWAYRHLLYRFVHRDLVALYKQTILGPLWFFIQPVLTTTAFTLIFGNFVKVSADGLPRPLFYLSGIIAWNYFSECINKTSSVFRENISIFGKIYFPRIIVPISIVISVFSRFVIQFILFLLTIAFYHINGEAQDFTGAVFLFPLIILLTAMQGLGLGLIVSALTVKYRDLVFLISFGLQLLMYSTTVIYPLSTTPDHLRWLVQLNPMTAIIETFRFGFLGKGSFSWIGICYSGCISVLVIACGIKLFSKTEQRFIETI